MNFIFAIWFILSLVAVPQWGLFPISTAEAKVFGFLRNLPFPLFWGQKSSKQTISRPTTVDSSNGAMLELHSLIESLRQEISILKAQINNSKKTIASMRKEKILLIQGYEDKILMITSEMQKEKNILENSIAKQIAVEKKKILKTLKKEFEEEKKKLEEELREEFEKEKFILKKELREIRISSDDNIRAVTELKKQLKSTQSKLTSKEDEFRSKERSYIRTVDELKETLVLQEKNTASLLKNKPQTGNQRKGVSSGSNNSRRSSIGPTRAGNKSRGDRKR